MHVLGDKDFKYNIFGHSAVIEIQKILFGSHFEKWPPTSYAHLKKIPSSGILKLHTLVKSTFKLSSVLQCIRI